MSDCVIVFGKNLCC